jgi:hypothetical protein
VACCTVRSIIAFSSLRLVGLLGEVGAQAVEAARPGRPSPNDPFFGGPQRRGIDAAGAHPSDLFGSDEAARFQDLKVLDHGRERHSEWAGEFADRSRSPTQPLHHYPSGRVRQRLEHEIERGALVKHLLKYHNRLCAARMTFRSLSLNSRITVAVVVHNASRWSAKVTLLLLGRMDTRRLAREGR